MKKINKYFSQALFEIAEKQKKKFKDEIKKLKIALEENDLFYLLMNNFLPIEKKFRLIDDVFTNFCSNEIINFLKILVQYKNLVDYDEIFNAFFDLCDRKKNVLNGIVFSTILLSSRKIHELEMKLSYIKQCDVKLNNKIDYSLIGGIKIIIDGENYEYSIASKINTIKDKIVRLLS